MTEAALEQARLTAQRLREIRASPLLRPYWQREETNFGVFDQPFASMPLPRVCLCDCDCGCKKPRHVATQTWVNEGTQTGPTQCFAPHWEDKFRHEDGESRILESSKAYDKTMMGASTFQDINNEDQTLRNHRPGFSQPSNIISPHNPRWRSTTEEKKSELRFNNTNEGKEELHMYTPGCQSVDEGSDQEDYGGPMRIQAGDQHYTTLRVSPSGSLDIIVRTEDGGEEAYEVKHIATSPGKRSMHAPASPHKPQKQTPVIHDTPDLKRNQRTRTSQKKIGREKYETHKPSSGGRREMKGHYHDVVQLSPLNFDSITDEDLLQLEVEVLRRHERLRRILEH